MISVHNVPYELQHIRNILKQHIRRSFRLSQAGNLKEESASGVGKAPSAASVRKCLAGESSAEKFEVGQICGVNLGCVGIISFLLSRLINGRIAGIGVFIDLAVTNALETSRTSQAGTKAANASEHVKVSNQAVSSPSCSAARKPKTSSWMLSACGVASAILIWLPCNS